MKLQAMKQNIHEQVFNEETVFRAMALYQTFLEKREHELQVAKEEGNLEKVEILSLELTQLQDNLAGLPVTKERTAPKKVVKNEVFTDENVKQARFVYQNHLDAKLDLLMLAMQEGDEALVEEVKIDLVNLRKNILDLDKWNRNRMQRREA